MSKLRIKHVWEDSALRPAVDALNIEKYDVYNYMEPEPSAVKDKPIVDGKGKIKSWRGLFVKSAYRLQHDRGLGRPQAARRAVRRYY